MVKKGVIVVYLSIFFVVCIVTYFFLSRVRTCNDGTLYNSCSETKPYFCSKGTLIEKASSCGCYNSSKVKKDKCSSVYETDPKKITLYYLLRGKKQEINITVYGGMSKYLSELPRYIDSIEKEPTLLDFKLRSLDEEKQRILLLSLVMRIKNLAKDKEDQARIAISLVQNIPFGNSNKTLQFGNTPIDYQRYPYEVLYDMEGICSEKSELLVFLLREIGYSSAFLYYNLENHEAVGIKCPLKKSLNNTGYCFIETTGPSIITDNKVDYVGVSGLKSNPEIIPISGELSFGGEYSFYEYRDSRILNKIREDMTEEGMINFFQHIQFQTIKKKYGLINFDEYQF